MTALALNLGGTPFSRRGSYFAVSQLSGARGDGVYLRTVRGDVRKRELMRLVVGGETAPTVTASAGILTLDGGGSRVDIALSGAGRAIVRVVRGEIEFDFQVRSQYDVVLQQSPGCWRFIASGANRNYLIRVDGGTAVLDAGWDGEKNTEARLTVGGGALVSVDEFGSSVDLGPDADFDGVVREAETDFEAWLQRLADPRDDSAASRLAAFVMWGALVPAGGALRRESMLMSKNWMTNVWSWDHCFNAMALWRDPAAAADQMLSLFDHQDEYGCLPDYVNDVGIERNFVKPPIHGWAIGYLLDRNGLEPGAVAELYEPLARWTDWWFEHRDYAGDGVPSYNHGNDSGWDNSTVFRFGMPVQGPDLLAYLALQMSTLARIATELGRAREAADWRNRSTATVALLLERFWVDGRFVARETLTQKPIHSDSLLTLMPLVLGDLLPAEQFDATVARLVDGDYLTPHGIATEPLTSPHYIADGYWRGPIWAPTTMLLIDGLARGGRSALAADLAGRFVATCAAAGMAENFDAVTGTGLRDLSMTWTAAVHLALSTDFALPLVPAGSALEGAR